MLILTRRVGETLVIEPSASLPSDMTVKELFASGPLIIKLMGMHSNQVRIGVQAHAQLSILRAELGSYSYWNHLSWNFSER